MKTKPSVQPDTAILRTYTASSQPLPLPYAQSKNSQRSRRFCVAFASGDKRHGDSRNASNPTTCCSCSILCGSSILGCFDCSVPRRHRSAPQLVAHPASETGPTTQDTTGTMSPVLNAVMTCLEDEEEQMDDDESTIEDA
ncbi:hypothetical protein EJB05_20378, partial [Eragrostis curvula]